MSLLHDSSLHHPSDPRWSEEPGFSASVADEILAATSWLKLGQVEADAYLRAHERAFDCRSHTMSARQHMQVLFVLGVAFLAAEAFDMSFTCLEEAQEVARALDDLGAWAELAYLRATTHSTRFQF